MGELMIDGMMLDTRGDAGNPRISVVIPAYNAARTMDRCLKALCSQSLPGREYEVVVVDDGSSDATADVAKGYGACVLQRRHLGPAAARNAGLRQAQGEIVLFTDADCAPTPTWIEEMVKPFADPDVIGVRGVYLTRQRALVARFVQMEYEDRYDRVSGRERIDFIDTYSAGYRRDVLLTNGGFDEAFPTASVEDQELSFRLARKGYKMVFAPGAQVYHLHDCSCWEYAARKFNIGYWKALLTRWYPERMVSDAHTPQVLKAQMALIGLAGLALLAAPAWLESLWLAAVLLVAFMISTLPFLWKAAEKSLMVAVASPFLLALRAAVLGIGFCVGRVSFARRKGDHRMVLGVWQRILKRCMDILGSLVGLLLLIPLTPLLALLIKLDSEGPVFYVQERVGEEGRVFRMYKFRSMVRDADQRSERPEVPGLKSRPDPRVTRVGRLLRRTSLDEAPQFYNVLRGEMSLVGPRPEEARVVCQYNDWHRQRLAVKPGMTGPMQINGRAELTLDRRVQLELAYIQRYSLWEDVKILARTLPALLRGTGAW
jgi:lipopolysaccharide/colanic/teichoic acid biosynthesis glycosyltransferase/glycosyltransferase involved in cell wall biosynthesis